MIPNAFHYIAAKPPPPTQIEVKRNPCIPSPCGPNAESRVVGDRCECSCFPEFLGSPPNCRRECTDNSDCSRALACIRYKCQDPCPGSCAPSAMCKFKEPLIPHPLCFSLIINYEFLLRRYCDQPYTNLLLPRRLPRRCFHLL